MHTLILIYFWSSCCTNQLNMEVTFQKCVFILLQVCPAIITASQWGTLSWTPAEKFREPQQEPGGYSKKTGTYKFIGRLESPGEGSYVGSYIPSQSTLHFGKDGEMQSVTMDQARGSGQGIFILTYPAGTVSWIPGGCSGSTEGKKKRLPANLIAGGLKPSSSDKMFICRANQDGNVGIGYFDLSNKHTCSVTFGGIEKQYEKFEILTLNAFGIISEAGISQSSTMAKRVNPMFRHFHAK